MMSSSPTPKLPKWIFFLTDAVLLFTAWLIASRSTGPLSPTAITAITACVIAGAIIGTLPLVLHYEREKNETLDDRQRALEALALTVTTSAEQISIAAQGLHEIAELAQKNLRQAEQLPQLLQDKVAEFQAQLTSTRDEERDELKRELAALRAAESERLAATAEKVRQAAAELTRAEAATQKSLAAAQAVLAKTPETITAATTTALAEIESRLAARTAATLAAISEAEAKRANPLSREESSATATPAASTDTPAGDAKPKHPLRRSSDIGRQITPIVPPTTAPFAGHIVAANPEPAENNAATTSNSDEAAATEGGNRIPPVVPPTAASLEGNRVPVSPAQATVAEPAATPAVTPVPDAAPASDSTPITEEPKLARKRAPRKPKPADSAEAALDLGIAPSPATADEFSQVAPDEAAEKVISSDGATRLLVTAYIGIGNRLFIRGEGPGLNWDKGVPLQFVSIGKWRWESADVTVPVKFKLYKNDETECAALGTRTLDSGHQQEVTATF
jgi:Na+-transporting NADH:ubiquinone oxidoreductase subunit NqrC